MPATPSRPAVFLDRDGTLIEDRGHLRDPSEVVFYPETVLALRLLPRRFALFLVTHQPGIAVGTLEPAQVERVNRHVVDHLARFGIRIEKVYCCPHQRSEGCDCIKPKPYAPLDAARAFGVDLRRSFTIGDHPHDVELARNAGATGIYVLTGHGEKHRADLAPGALVASGIWEAALRIALTDDATPGTTRTHADIEADIGQAAALLRGGGVVAFPTETVYGLGADAFDARAVARVFEIKGRPRFDPLIVHVGDLAQVETVAAAFPATARALADRFWPGPLTLVLPKGDRIPAIVTSGLPTVAVRMPAHPLALALIREAGVPLAAPSANPFGRISPTTAEHVRAQLGEAVDRVLDGGPCRVGIESTIVSLIDGAPTVLRVGGLPVEDIESVVGPVRRSATAAPCPTPLAPGQLASHYAPRTPLRFREANESVREPRARFGLLTLRAPPDAHGFAAVEALSPGGDLREAAANLFAAMHRLDALGLDAILVERFPETGLGTAINDRLRRAAAARPSPRAS